MAFRTKTSETYGNIRGKPNQPCNYLNRAHKSKVNICGQYISYIINKCHHKLFLDDFNGFIILLKPEVCSSIEYLLLQNGLIEFCWDLSTMFKVK